MTSLESGRVISPEYQAYKEISEMLKGKSPISLGIILDGNRRWADQHSVTRKLGHMMGKERAKKILEFLEGLPLNALLWAFSTDNWGRPEEEKKNLFKLYAETITHELLPEAIKKNSIIIHYGRKYPLLDASGKILIPALPDHLLEAIVSAQEKTKNNTGQIIGLAINYSGGDELTRIHEAFQQAIADGKIDPKTPFTRPYWHQFSDDKGRMGNLHTIMRTSGESRLSGFGWRADYGEPYRIEKMLPDVEPIDVAQGLLTTLKRNQRFGR